jgi:triacylglycerol esterase/lipase EstA (alpha/beta hydrolase family)
MISVEGRGIVMIHMDYSIYPDPVPYWVSESIAAVFKTFSHYFTDLAAKTPTIQKDKTPILLVHGYMHNSSAWIDLHEKMEKIDAIGSVFTINLGLPFNHSIEAYSQLVKTKVEEIQKLTEREDLILIGHSMGGVISTYYALNDAKELSVKKVITLGSPLKGTYLGYLGLGPCARQMSYNSEFSNQLIEKMAESSYTQFINIGSPNDAIILPPESATPLQTARVSSHHISGMGHIAYLTSQEVHDFVIQLLRQ